MLKRTARLSAILSLVAIHSGYAAYQPVKPHVLKTGEIAVTQPGSYSKAGTTYVLMKDIKSPRSAIFLGKDVTLDLNGYTITYADGYKHLPNFDFSKELQGWDISKAPGAKVKNTTMINPMVGDNSLILPQGGEVVSEYILLPEANRAYYAMVSAASHQMHFGIYIEDEQGTTVECAFKFGNNVRPCAPEKRRCTKLGGGTVFALMFGKPAGKYRVRVKAVNQEVVIGAIDLLPALDVGIGIVEKTAPWAYYKCIFDGDSTAFFDYTEKGSSTSPVASIPVVTGTGKIVIKNGTIKSGAANMRTWGIQSSAGGVRVDIENVKFIATGINACAISAPFGLLKDCSFELDYPFIIDRHGVRGDPVNYFGKEKATEITGCEFVGGQGCLVVSGKESKVHHNVFKPKQTVTNHYAVHVAADGCEVYENEFAPIVGGGINIFYQRHVRIHNNSFAITSAPPNNEYGNSDYSTNAIRITDYNANHGNKKGWCEDNEIYDNTFNVVAREYPGCHKDYKSMAYAIFMSVGGGQNYVHDNVISIKHENPGSKNSGAYAFYIGGSRNGGTYYNNKITTNVNPVWIGNRYGVGNNVTLYNNTFTRSEGAGDFVWFKLGWYKHPTENVSFYSNTFPGSAFSAQIDDYTSGYKSAYSRGWILKVNADPGKEISVLSAAGKEVFKGKANDKGQLTVRLKQFEIQGDGQKIVNGKRVVQFKTTDVSKYDVVCGGKTVAVVMDKDKVAVVKQE